MNASRIVVTRILMAAIAVAVFAADQATKTMVERRIPEWRSRFRRARLLQFDQHQELRGGVRNILPNRRSGGRRRC